jgi:integrase
MAKRIKTDYKGVSYRMELRLGSETQTERVYYIRYRQGGRESKQIEERAGRESEGMTAAKANNLRSDRARGKSFTNKEQRDAIGAAKAAEEGRPTIERLWMQYDEGNIDRKVRKIDAGFYVNHLRAVFAQKTPDEIITLDIDRLRLKKLKTLAPQTVKHILSLLRRIINYGVAKGLCPMPDPSRLHFIFPRVDNIKTESLTREQMAAYLRALDEEPDQNAAAFLRLALVTGMRRGALLNLQWTDVDFERDFVLLRGEAAKNAKTERIPLSSLARSVLESIARRENSPYVFPGHGGRKRTEFKRIALRVRDKAGLPKDFRPLHGLRHTFASWLASSGDVDLYTLQKLLTHSSHQMTQRYAHLADEALQRAAGVTDKLFQGVTDDNINTLVAIKIRKAR